MTLRLKVDGTLLVRTNHDTYIDSTTTANMFESGSQHAPAGPAHYRLLTFG